MTTVPARQLTHVASTAATAGIAWSSCKPFRTCVALSPPLTCLPKSIRGNGPSSETVRCRHQHPPTSSWSSVSRVLAAASAPAAAVEAAAEDKVFRSTIPWQWHPKGVSSPIAIQTVSFSEESPSTSSPVLLFLPALSDVATFDEWEPVVARLLAPAEAAPLGYLSSFKSCKDAKPQVLSLDWPGFGSSGSPSLLYTLELLEQFLVDYTTHLFPGHTKDNPVPLVILGAGHAATIALRCVARGALSPAALVAVAPTWGGPLPIVFGNDPKMTARYSILRNVIRTPGLGWALYSYLTSEKQIKMQYMTHVYGDADNVTPGLVEKRTQITKRDGGRFAPASFLTGLLDPAKSREEFLGLFAAAEEQGVPVAVLATARSPKRSRREMESLQGAPGVSVYETIPGALLAHEEHPQDVAKALEDFFASEVFRKRALSV